MITFIMITNITITFITIIIVTITPSVRGASNGVGSAPASIPDNYSKCLGRGVFFKF